MPDDFIPIRGIMIIEVLAGGRNAPLAGDVVLESRAQRFSHVNAFKPFFKGLIIANNTSKVNAQVRMGDGRGERSFAAR